MQSTFPLIVIYSYESHANIVDAIFYKYTFSKFFLRSDYNIPGDCWSSDKLELIDSGGFNHTSHSIIDYFYYHNIFQLQ